MQEDYVIVVKRTPEDKEYYLKGGILSEVEWTEDLTKARRLNPRPNKINSIDYEAIRDYLKEYENYPINGNKYSEDTFSIARVVLEHCLYL